MRRVDSSAFKLSYLTGWYDSIRGSNTSHRRKSSYRKPIKRSINKLIRRIHKKSDRNEI